jgi:predicted nucleic acid-binding protein
MAEVVVANAGPLMALAKLNLLHLLKLLYGRVQFTRSVYSEVVIEGIRQGFEDAHTLKQFLHQEGWEPTEVLDVPPSLASAHLDNGERDSLALASALHGLLLMDEERGREVAQQLGLPVRGTLGVLIQAYRSDLIDVDQLRFHFSELERRTDVWISPVLCRRLLREALELDQG